MKLNPNAPSFITFDLEIEGASSPQFVRLVLGKQNQLAINAEKSGDRWSFRVPPLQAYGLGSEIPAQIEVCVDGHFIIAHSSNVDFGPTATIEFDTPVDNPVTIDEPVEEGPKTVPVSVIEPLIDAPVETDDDEDEERAIDFAPLGADVAKFMLPKSSVKPTASIMKNIMQATKDAPVKQVHRIKEHISPTVRKNYSITRGEIIDI